MIKQLLLASLILAAPAGAQDASLMTTDGRVVPISPLQMQLSFSPVVEEAAPAVVNVYTRRVVETPMSRDPFFSRFFGSRPQEQNSLGSGVIVEDSGVIVTNNHVVEGATELRVVLADRREFEAEILLTDPDTDLAVLRIESDEPLPVMAYHMANDVQVGDLVLAIGNPFGVGQTVTQGIVSAVARTDVGGSDFGSFIQTDAAINPGNSGGALVNTEAELVGINTMIFSRSGGSNGIGFAIPVEMVRRVVDSALTEGELIRPWLGARLQTVDSDIADVFGQSRPRGVLVNEVYPGAAAADGGLRQGDIVLSVDGHDVNTENGTRFHLATRAAGEEAEFTILREGREVALDIPVEPAPGELEPRNLVVEGQNPLNGLSLVRLSPAFNQTVGLDPFLEGVVVANVQRRSIASRFGFRPGDILLTVMETDIDTTDDAERVLDRYDGSSDWQVAIERRGERFETTLQLYR